MIKVVNLQHIEPKNALQLIREAGIFPYLINWSCNIDEKNKRLIFNLTHGGGGFEEEVEKVEKELDKFIKSIDTA